MISFTISSHLMFDRKGLIIIWEKWKIEEFKLRMDHQLTSHNQPPIHHLPCHPLSSLLLLLIIAHLPLSLASLTSYPRKDSKINSSYQTNYHLHLIIYHHPPPSLTINHHHHHHLKLLISPMKWENSSNIKTPKF